MSVSVGIDLGTTFSAVARIDPVSKKPEIILNGEGNRITPSVIQFWNDQKIFGNDAEEAFIAGETNCVTTFKRQMGKSEPYCCIDGVSYTAEDLSSMLLQHLKEDAETTLGEPIKDAVITVPAYFYSLEREATKRAAEKAGLKVKAIIDEPNAAAMAYGLDHWRENANILVYDLGGGTFDVTLVHMGKDGDLSTITTKGDHLLGGRDWDSRIEDMLIEQFEDETNLEIGSDLAMKSIIRGLSEDVKKKLSAMTSVKISTSFPGYGSASTSITRQDFESNTLDLIDRTGSLCKAVLEDVGLSVHDITDVLLVGGSTRMPQVSSYLTQLFGKAPISHVNPDEAVALGAAIQAEKATVGYAQLNIVEQDGKKVTSRNNSAVKLNNNVQAAKKLENYAAISLRETTAHAMGVVTVDDEKNRYYNEVIIPANHPRPVRAAKRFLFYPSGEAENKLEIYVLQGDSENPLDCQIPYKYIVSGIQHVDGDEESGIVMRIQYSYDNNGIIHVQARQGSENVDLPIHKDDAPVDIEKFGRPVKSDSSSSSDLTGAMVKQEVPGDVVHKYKEITFSNVVWEKYDNINDHPSGRKFHEPKVHVKANEKKIEFHGYNISAMDEGVFYHIGPNANFIIECNIDTTKIKPHPGGCAIISLGIIIAELDQNGGVFFLNGVPVTKVKPKFHLKMELTNGKKYSVYINKKLVGSEIQEAPGGVDVKFGFKHNSHYCHLLSHAYITNINMMLGLSKSEDASADTDTWDD